MHEQLYEKFGVDLTAVAHKLARILWAMVKRRRPYDPQRLGNHNQAETGQVFRTKFSTGYEKYYTPRHFHYREAFSA